jgi:nucleoside-diphosphate kinase
VVVFALEGPNAVALARGTIGKTRPHEAEPGSIRGDLAIDVSRNVVHGSDGGESGQREVANFFSDAELYPGWDRTIEPWLVGEN